VTGASDPPAPGGDGRAGFALVGSRTLLRARSTVRLDTLRDADGTTFEREVVEHADAVAMVAVDDGGRVAMVRQYRHATGGMLLEIPAGTLDVPGETPEGAAHRELAEETGLAAGTLRELGRIWNSAGWCDEATTLFLATDLRPAPAPPEYVPRAEEAAMAVEWHDLEDLVRAAVAGALTDAKTVVGVLRASSALRGGV
jgi:8-oxo-dGTP pyrophosphatase MutT (NUDIX family)